MRITSWSLSAVTMPLSLLAGYFFTIPTATNMFIEVTILAIGTGIAGPLMSELHGMQRVKKLEVRVERLEKKMG